MTNTDKLAEALRRAFNLGQTYGQQADSESYKQNAKADDTYHKFNVLVAETVTALEAERAAPAGQIGEVVEMDDGCRHVVWRDGTPEPGTKLYATPAAPALGPDLLTNIESPFNACMHREHCKQWKAAAGHAPKPLTDADVVEGWRTTEAARDDYGWTSCEWFQAGVRFAQRHYGITGDKHE